MANRIIITDQNYSGDTIRLVPRTTLPMNINDIEPGVWSFVNTSNAATVVVDGVISQLRTASTNLTKSIHSGHSLTDAYLSGPWPGGLHSVRDSLMEPSSYSTDPGYIIQNTIPGSPLHWRWNVGQTDTNQYDAKRNPNLFDTLMITEGGPPPRTNNLEGMRESIMYLCNFAANQVVNGRGNEVILWSIWPALNGPGTDTENPVPRGDWTGFTFRTGLDEYWRSFKMMADYTTWKIKSMYPSLPSDWRVWLFPGDRWMARLYDDIQLGLVPGLTDHRDIMDDDIHPDNLAIYGLNCFVATCLYQINLQEAENVWVRSEFVTQEQAEYFWRIAWEVATEFEHVGMGGTEGTEMVWTPSMGDLLPDWTFEGATPPEEPEEPDITGRLPNTGLVLGAWSGGVHGYAGTTVAPLLAPHVTGNTININDALTAPQSIVSSESYLAIKFSMLDPDTSAIADLLSLKGGPDSWSSPNVQLSYNDYIRNCVSRISTASSHIDMGVSPTTGTIGLTPVTFESHFSLDEIGVAIEKGAWLIGPNSNRVQHGPFSHIHIGPVSSDWSGTVRIHSLVIMDRKPTDTERLEILAWMDTPSGGIPYGNSEEPVDPEIPVEANAVLPVSGVVLGAWSGGVHGAASTAASTFLSSRIEGNYISIPPSSSDDVPSISHTFTPSSMYLAAKVKYKSQPGGGVHQIIAVRNGNVSYANPSVDISSNPGVDNAFAGMANGPNNITPYATEPRLGEVGTNPFIVEGRFSSEGASVSINKRPWDAFVTSSATLGSYSHIQIGGAWNDIGFDYYSLVIMDRIPTAQERSNIHAWLDNPNGGSPITPV